MSIFYFPTKNTNKFGPRKRGKGNFLDNHSLNTKIAKEINNNAEYIPEKNAVYRQYKQQMNGVKNPK
ncbi:hypothetical protein ACOI1C_06400 [Bacillus sp. DJP31]|uniref:hypothetical protein n=1 Tax=Bacillus sp. DJP31 TaxID=3409789 RepID=UPI003BB581B5